MKSKIYAFSVKAQDQETTRIINDLRKCCLAEGRSFSWAIIEALKQYTAEGNLPYTAEGANENGLDHSRTS